MCIYLSGCAALLHDLSNDFFGYPGRHSLKSKQAYINNHPGLSRQIKENILKGAISIGMTKEQFLMAWYHPKSINKTVTKYGINEQYVYGGCSQYGCNYKFFYFKNGILTAWQD